MIKTGDFVIYTTGEKAKIGRVGYKDPFGKLIIIPFGGGNHVRRLPERCTLLSKELEKGGLRYAKSFT